MKKILGIIVLGLLLSGNVMAKIKNIGNGLSINIPNNYKYFELTFRQLVSRFPDITSDEQINLAKHFGPLERHIYVKGRERYPEILRIIKEPEEKRQWGETWHTDVSYNPKPTKVIILNNLTHLSEKL